MKSQDPKEESFQMMAEHNILHMAVHSEHCLQYAKQPQTTPAGLSGVDTGDRQCLVFGVMIFGSIRHRQSCGPRKAPVD
jgi:hypothetical protein